MGKMMCIFLLTVVIKCVFWVGQYMGNIILTVQCFIVIVGC